MLLDPTWPDVIIRGAVLAAVAMIWVIFLVRIVGLRAFSKMTSFDFVMTVATGSMVASASQTTSWTSFVQALCALVGIFALQWIVAWFRKKSDRFETLVQNEPVVLMRDGVIDDAALAYTRVEKDDLIAKLRANNVLKFGDVRAVVLETTGDMSVLHGEKLDDELLAGAERAPNSNLPT